MVGLFDNDEAYQQAVVKPKRKLVRNLSGRFCTPEERRMELVEKENVVLRHKVELYKRNRFSESDRATRKDRENYELLSRLRSCQEELKKLRRAVKKKKKL